MRKVLEKRAWREPAAELGVGTTLASRVEAWDFPDAMSFDVFADLWDEALECLVYLALSGLCPFFWVRSFAIQAIRPPCRDLAARVGSIHQDAKS